MPRSSVGSLAARIAQYPSLVVGYSGGVDSSLLAVVARQTLGRERCVAVLGLSPSLSRAQREQAERVAQAFDLHLVTVDTHEFQSRGYVANSLDRCFFCKQELWTRLTEFARRARFAVIADGTNADDLGEHRPGLRAAEAFGIRSPLAEAGFTKDRVRATARELGLPIWDAPAAPCLSSRVTYGLSVTPRRVRQVEESEAFLRSLGITGDLRVRHRGDEARIEVALSEFPRVHSSRERIARHLTRLGFRKVTLDLGGYRRGSQLEGTSQGLEVLSPAG